MSLVQFDNDWLRQEELHSNMRFFYFCKNGVAGFVVPTKKVKQKTPLNYLKQKKDMYGYFYK